MEHYQFMNHSTIEASPDEILTSQQESERGIAGFVSKLYQCLEAPDDGHKYARWCKHNDVDMFIIECIPKFTEIVLPRLFKHCKFASFVRQLNIYGFQRDTDARKSKDSKETCRWYHIHFRPGRHDLFHLIRRKAPRYSRRSKKEEEIESLFEEEVEADLQDEFADNRRLSFTSSISDHHHNHQFYYPQQQEIIPQPILLDHEQLQMEILNLRKSYTNMYKTLTNELNKSLNIIEFQKSRIELLESLIQQQTFSMQQQQYQNEQMFYNHL